MPYTLRKHDRIVAAVNAQVKRVTHKYGVKISQNIKEALAIDAINNDTYWSDAIQKEMGNLKVAFDILEDDVAMPPGWTKTSGNLVFNVRMSLE